ncbi:glycoside hydrolase family 18 protein [Trichoderma virens Gv29-8]|uniref:chitinase n=1 Tax=Hypocrea virens (strain Gv29-8 / FGSC 10586) TaxID=413071 RepID=G9MJQ5_HYPVG|nr:glycoside hydrolase family 18 protein [Trichoderma virens Gv29-8]EHK25718.1 glycoside hydrolase family 18 protein [Trichoderma virens Gv29-8]
MPYINAVYYPSWRVYKDKPPSSLDVASITHIFYAFALDQWADNEKEVDGIKGCLAAIHKLKAETPHIKTIISIGGGSSSKEFPVLAANLDARRTFALAIREFCEKHHLDGADIDWEHPQDPDAGANYLLFLQDIRRALPSPWFLLTTALPVGEYCLKHIDISAAAAILDMLNLMTYDFCGGWTDVSGHHAQLLPPSQDINEVYPTLRKSAHTGVTYLLSRGFPANKIILGIPAYARFFSQARGAGHPFKGSGEIDYCDLPDKWVCEACVEEAGAAACFVDQDGDKGFVSFDVPSTVRIKARYAKSMGLGGLFYWTGVGDRSGDESLVAAGWSELQS